MLISKIISAISEDSMTAEQLELGIESLKEELISLKETQKNGIIEFEIISGMFF